jgi:hypothetical protein
MAMRRGEVNCFVFDSGYGLEEQPALLIAPLQPGPHISRFAHDSPEAPQKIRKLCEILDIDLTLTSFSDPSFLARRRMTLIGACLC